MDSPVPSSQPPRPKIIPVPRRPRSELTRELLETHIDADAGSAQNAMVRGTHWFYWIAALSLVNSIIALSGGRVAFLAGLAVSQIADGIAANLGLAGPYFSIGIDLIIAFFVCGIGYLASHGSRAALIMGMVLYALDGVVFLAFSGFLPAVFHAYILYKIFQGWKARQQLDQLRARSQQPPISLGKIS